MIGDTVVLFSLQDFLCNPKWHKDSLERGLRRRRGKRGLKGPGHTQRGVMRSKREVGLAQASLKAEKGRRVLARLQAAAGVVV